MTKLYVMAQVAGSRLARLSKDEAGVVSFEYVIVAACVVGAVSLAFGTGTTTGIGKVLSDALTVIAGKVTTALG